MNITRSLLLVAFTAAFLGAGSVYAQAPAGSTGQCKDGSYTTADTKKGACSAHGGVKDWYAKKPSAAAATASSAAPSGSTGQCKDGSYTDAAAKKGACSGHGGVKSWYASSAGAAPASAPMASPAPAAPAAMAAPASKPMQAAQSAPMPATAAAGGGPGKVWVNTSSKVYHCSGDEWYGKTKAGEYMSEADAKAKGNRPAHNKACG